MRARITKRLVDGLKPIGTDYYAFDTDTIGFAVRVRATGGMSYIVQYKAGSGRGAQARRVTLGGVGKMTPEQARAAARKVLGSVAQGKDPARIRQRKNLTRCFRIVANESWFFSIQGAGGLQYCITAPNPLAQPFGARFR